MNIRGYKRRVESVMVAKVPRKVKKFLGAHNEELYLYEPWKYVDGRREKGVYEFVYRVPIGYSALDLERQIDALYAACGAVVEIKDYAGAVMIRIFPEDFPDIIRYKEDYANITSGKDILIGFDRQGAPITHSLRVPHLMVAGKSGYGKTDLIRWILLQLIAHNTPEQIEIWIVDLKGFSFMPFKGVPHITRIVRDLPGAKLLLEQAVKIMKDRSNEVWNASDRSKTEGYKTIFVLIDEAFHISPKQISSAEEKKLARVCDEAAAKISGTGREAGVGLIYCTQRPDADVINPLVKANMDAKICFKTETASNSQIVLDKEGAEKLPQGKPGRVLFSRDGLLEAQVPYIGNDEAWDEILKPYKEEKTNEQEGLNFDSCEGHSDIFDGGGGEILFREWEPIQTGKRNPQEIGGGKINRGQAEGDRQEQDMAPILDWSEVFRDK